MNDQTFPMSKIAVIIPVYKVEAYLDRCVESVVRAAERLVVDGSGSGTGVEIVLVDDGSPDRCGEMCEEGKRKVEKVGGGGRERDPLKNGDAPWSAVAFDSAGVF